MRTPNCKYSRKNSYLQVGIQRRRASTFGEKFTVVTTGKTFGKRHCAWGAQKLYAIRADTSIDFQALTRSVHTCSKRLLFEHPCYRKFTDTCGCNPKLARQLGLWEALRAPWRTERRQNKLRNVLDLGLFIVGLCLACEVLWGISFYFSDPDPVGTHNLGSLVIPGIHNSMIFRANKECPYKSSWIL